MYFNNNMKMINTADNKSTSQSTSSATTTTTLLPTPPASPIDCQPTTTTTQIPQESTTTTNRKRAYSLSFIQNNATTINKKPKKLDSDCLKAFLKRKGSPNTCDDQFKRSLLSWACMGRSVEAVQDLMSSVHLDINLKTGPNKTTALHEASLVGFKEGLDLLLEHPEIDVNAINGQGQSALHCAIQNNHMECVKVLLAAGARIDLFCQGRLPIHLAVLYGHQRAVSLVLSKQNCHMNNPSQLDMLWEKNRLDGRSTIESAIVTGYTSTLQLLLDHDSATHKEQPEHQKRCGLVSLAIEWNRIECLRLLVKRGCVMDDNSMLMAVQQRKIDMVRALASAGAKACLPNGQNPSFLYAANHGFLDMIPLLLTPNTSKDCIQQAVLLASSLGFRDQLASVIVHTLKSFAAAAAVTTAKKNVSNTTSKNDTISTSSS